MSTAATLEQRPLPEQVEVTGQRMSGVLPVSFGRSGHLDPLIAFGADTFGADTNAVVNGIDYVVCNARAVLYDNQWTLESCHYMRRTGTLDYGTDAAHRAMRNWLTIAAGRIAEQHPSAFNKIPAGVYRTFDNDAQRMQQASIWTNTINEFCHAVATGTYETTTDTTDLPKRIRWDRIDHRFGVGHPYTAADQPSAVVGAVTSNGTLVGYVASTGRYRRRNAGGSPLLIPLAIVTAEDYEL